MALQMMLVVEMAAISAEGLKRTMVFRNDRKFSDRLILANSADLDQIAHRGAV